MKLFRPVLRFALSESLDEWFDARIWNSCRILLLFDSIVTDLNINRKPKWNLLNGCTRYEPPVQKRKHRRANFCVVQSVSNPSVERVPEALASKYTKHFIWYRNKIGVALKLVCHVEFRVGSHDLSCSNFMCHFTSSPSLVTTKWLQYKKCGLMLNSLGHATLKHIFSIMYVVRQGLNRAICILLVLLFLIGHEEAYCHPAASYSMHSTPMSLSTAAWYVGCLLHAMTWPLASMT